MKKTSFFRVISLILTLMMLLGTIFSVSAEDTTETLVAPTINILKYDDYTEIDYESFGENLIPDSTVSYFNEDGTYKDYYIEGTATAGDTKAWWDKVVLTYNYFTLGDKTYGSPKLNNRITNDTSLSHTNDGSGAIVMPAGKKTYLPMPSLSANKYYLFTAWVNKKETSFGFEHYLYTPDASGNKTTTWIKKSKDSGTTGWVKVSWIISTGSYSQGAQMAIWCNNITYMDEIEVYELDATYAQECITAGELVFEPKAASVTLFKFGTDEYNYNDIDFSDFGENLIPDSTVSYFNEDGTYKDYYIEGTATVGDPKAWWDKAANNYLYFTANSADYASPKVKNCISNDTTLSHTSDGSGVLVLPKQKHNYTALPAMKANKYYVLTAWINKTTENLRSQFYLNTVDESGNNKTDWISNSRWIATTGWVRVTWIIYTGTNTQSAQMFNIYLDGAGYLDDVELYQLDNTLAEKSLEAGKLLSEKELRPTEVSTLNTTYASGQLYDYSSVYFGGFGENLIPDSTVSQFNEDGTYKTYYASATTSSYTVADPNAWWDRVGNLYQAFCSTPNPIYQSMKTRNLLVKDVSHTPDGSGSISVDKNMTISLPMPDLDYREYYLISFWINQSDTGNLRVTLKPSSLNTSYYDQSLWNFPSDWQRYTFIYYTGGSSVRQRNSLELYSSASYYLDEISVCKLDADYAEKSIEAKKLLANREKVLGDVNCDDIINIKDLVRMKKVIAEMTYDYLPVNADFDGDGKVSATDTVELATNLLAEKESTEPDDGLDDSDYLYCTESILKNSIYYEGDTNRLAYKIKEALADENHITKIACLGDSITEGTSVGTGLMHYANNFLNYWKKNINENATMDINGIGGTTSYFGVHWVDDVVLNDAPDIIFIEYVNDSNTELYCEAMDSLIRKCLSMENKPAVILLEMAYEEGSSTNVNAQETHAIPAKAYGVPMISWYDAVKGPLATGELLWSQLCVDKVHPGGRGHKMLAEMMWYFTKNVIPQAETAVEPDAFSMDAVTDNSYINAEFLDNTKITPESIGDFTEGSTGNALKNGWSTTNGGEITFKLTGKIIGIMVLRTTDGLQGNYEIYIDGELVKTWPGTGGYTQQEAVKLKEFDTSAEHTVTVKVIENDNGENDGQILGWLVS